MCQKKVKFCCPVKYVNIQIFSQLTWLSQTNCGWWRKATYTFEFSVKSSIRIRYFSSCAKNKLNSVDQCYYLFIKYYSPLHVSSIKCSSSRGHSCIHAAYGTVTLYKSSWWPVNMQLAAYRQATRNSYRERQYHMLHVYNYVLLKMSTWCSKHAEENIILWINNNQCIKLVIYV